MHEIVTLQFGQQANYVATHYWNVQESYFTYAGEDESPVDHDVSFRPGIGADGSDTYTPRTLIYDLKGAFGTLRRENALYEIQHPEDPLQLGQWSGSTVPLQTTAIAPSPYQQALDQGLELPALTSETVRFWSDYNHVFYHPRSIVQLHEYELNSSLMPFEQWHTGEELFSNLDREHDLLDRDLRPFLEECDQLQGIQVLSGTDDAWGGFSSRYLERIADELGKGCRWAFGLQDSRRVRRDRQILQCLNIARSVSSLDVSSSMHVPIISVPPSLPRSVSLDPQSRWHTSALQSLAIESVTLPTRLRSSHNARATFDALESILCGDWKRHLAACSFSVRDADAVDDSKDLPEYSDARMTNGLDHDLEDSNSRHAEALDIDLFPEYGHMRTSEGRRVGKRSHVFGKVELRRQHPPTSSEESSHHGRSRPAQIEARTLMQSSGLLFPVLPSYPTIFQFPTQPAKLEVQTSLSTSTAVAARVREIESIARRFLSIDERESLCDGLAVIADEYDEGWMSDDESDDD